jgi:hypothetical protein
MFHFSKGRCRFSHKVSARRIESSQHRCWEIKIVFRMSQFNIPSWLGGDLKFPVSVFSQHFSPKHNVGWSGAIGVLDKRDQMVVISMAASGTDVCRIEYDGASLDESLKRGIRLSEPFGKVKTAEGGVFHARRDGAPCRRTSVRDTGDSGLPSHGTGGQGGRRKPRR